MRNSITTVSPFLTTIWYTTFYKHGVEKIFDYVSLNKLAKCEILFLGI